MFYMWQVPIGKDQRHGIPGFLRETGEGKEVGRNNEGGERKKSVTTTTKKTTSTPKTTRNLHLMIFKN